MCLPRQFLAGALCIAASSLFIWNGINNITTDWISEKATPTAISPMQERIRNGKDEYFFSITYTYSTSFTFKLEEFPVTTYMHKQSQEEIDAGNYPPVTIWYNSRDPHEILYQEPYVYISMYFSMALILLAMSLYFRWMLIKYYQLEITT